jgi:hypothetical protein
VRVPALDETVTQEEIDATRASRITPETRPETRAVVEVLPAPELRPPYSDLHLDSEGFVWLSRYRNTRLEPDDPTLWYVFDPDGSWLGSIMTPPRFTVFEIGEDYLLGVRRDELDVEHVQLLRLRR